MDLDQIATETANKVAMAPIADIEKSVQVVLSALNKVVKETREDMLELLASTDETVALHSKFTGKYRGI